MRRYRMHQLLCKAPQLLGMNIELPSTPYLGGGKVWGWDRSSVTGSSGVYASELRLLASGSSLSGQETPDC